MKEVAMLFRVLSDSKRVCIVVGLCLVSLLCIPGKEYAQTQRENIILYPDKKNIYIG